MRPIKETGIVTVAAVREPREDGAIECLFNERQQIVALPPSARSRAAITGRLKEALERNAPLPVVLNIPPPRRERTRRAACPP